jgi:hypothetical protein
MNSRKSFYLGPEVFKLIKLRERLIIHHKIVIINSHIEGVQKVICTPVIPMFKENVEQFIIRTYTDVLQCRKDKTPISNYIQLCNDLIIFYNVPLGHSNSTEKNILSIMIRLLTRINHILLLIR